MPRTADYLSGLDDCEFAKMLKAMGNREFMIYLGSYAFEFYENCLHAVLYAERWFPRELFKAKRYYNVAVYRLCGPEEQSMIDRFLAPLKRTFNQRFLTKSVAFLLMQSGGKESHAGGMTFGSKLDCFESVRRRYQFTCWPSILQVQPDDRFGWSSWSAGALTKHDCSETEFCHYTRRMQTIRPRLLTEIQDQCRKTVSAVYRNTEAHQADLNDEYFDESKLRIPYDHMALEMLANEHDMFDHCQDCQWIKVSDGRESRQSENQRKDLNCSTTTPLIDFTCAKLRIGGFLQEPIREDIALESVAIVDGALAEDQSDDDAEVDDELGCDMSTDARDMFSDGDDSVLAALSSPDHQRDIGDDLGSDDDLF